MSVHSFSSVCCLSISLRFKDSVSQVIQIRDASGDIGLFRGCCFKAFSRLVYRTSSCYWLGKCMSEYVAVSNDQNMQQMHRGFHLIKTCFLALAVLLILRNWVRVRAHPFLGQSSLISVNLLFSTNKISSNKTNIPQNILHALQFWCYKCNPWPVVKHPNSQNNVWDDMCREGERWLRLNLTVFKIKILDCKSI